MDDGQPARALDQGVRRLLDESPNAVLGMDAAGTVDYANARAGELFGRDRTDLVGARIAELLPDWDGPGGTGTPAAGTDRGRTHAAPAPGRTVTGVLRDGQTISLALGVTRLEDVAGGTWVLVTLRDESARISAERDLTDAERGLAAVAALNGAVVRAPDEQTLYAEVCRIAVEVGHYLTAWVGAVDAGGRVRALASAGDLGPFVADLGLRVDTGSPDRDGPTVAALVSGRPVFVDDYARDPSVGRNRQRGLDLGVRAVAALPLLRNGRTVAAVVLYSPHRGVFNQARRVQLQGLAYNVSVGLDRFDAARRLDEAVALREQLHQRLVLAQEEERERIAGDVHDESIQSLAALDLRLGLLHRDLGDQAPELAGSVGAVREIVRSVTDGLRLLLFELEMPPPGTSLHDVVTETAAHALEHAAVAWSVEVADDLDDVELTDGVHVQLVRIVKEALANVRRHAAAHRVHLALRARDGGVEVAVTDDGRGLAPGADVPRRGHRGLTTMRDRAALVGGWLRIEPAHPGTTVRFWLPAGGCDPAGAPELLVPVH